MLFPGASAAFAHFTALDPTRVRAGPTSVRRLDDWGANVIKIEAHADIEPAEPAGSLRDVVPTENSPADVVMMEACAHQELDSTWTD